MQVCQQSVQRLVVKLGQLAEGFGSLQNPPLHSVGNSLGKEKKLVLVGSQRLRQLVDQALAGVLPEIETPGFDLAQIGEADADLRSQVTEAPTLHLPKLSHLLAERVHGPFHAC